MLYFIKHYKQTCLTKNYEQIFLEGAEGKSQVSHSFEVLSGQTGIPKGL